MTAGTIFLVKNTFNGKGPGESKLTKITPDTCTERQTAPSSSGFCAIELLTWEILFSEKRSLHLYISLVVVRYQDAPLGDLFCQYCPICYL